MRLLAGSLALALAACGGVTAETSDFDPYTAVRGPDNTVNPLVGDKVVYWIESTVAKEPPHRVHHQLDIELFPRSIFPSMGPAETLKYDSATDETAKPLDIKTLGTGRCPYGAPDCLKYMSLSVGLSDAALRQHVLTGYGVKIRARTGESEVLSLPAAQVQQELSAVDRLVAGPAGAPPPGAPRLGIGVIAATAEPYDDLPRGVIVVVAPAQTPAAVAGIKPGDVLLSINGEPIRVSDDVGRIMGGLGTGTSATLQFKRGSEFLSAKVQL